MKYYYFKLRLMYPDGSVWFMDYGVILVILKKNIPFKYATWFRFSEGISNKKQTINSSEPKVKTQASP